MTKEENEARLARLKSIVASMPEKPGSYQYYDADHTIIYVGKAKNLKRRVSSYFHRDQSAGFKNTRYQLHRGQYRG